MPRIAEINGGINVCGIHLKTTPVENISVTSVTPQCFHQYHQGCINSTSNIVNVDESLMLNQCFNHFFHTEGRYVPSTKHQFLQCVLDCGKLKTPFSFFQLQWGASITTAKGGVSVRRYRCPSL